MGESQAAVGGTPNLAARLQGLATADQIVIATSTRRLIGNAFELINLGEKDLKGIAEPVHAWRVERALVTESRFETAAAVSTLTPLVGATKKWICCFVGGPIKEGEDQVVLLSGEPGIGKSRILSSFMNGSGPRHARRSASMLTPTT